MARKLTILIDDAVYEGLHRMVGRGGISKFIEELARPHLAQRDLSAQYIEAARDAAREAEAREWGEGLAGGFDASSAGHAA
ncbi:MAG: addiction module antitoxin [Gemmatimonadaceae bacterium]